MIARSFSPVTAGTVNISVSSSSKNVLVENRNAPITVRIVNNGTATVWLNSGGSSVAATTTTGFPVGPGVHEVLTFSPDANGNLYIAAIAAGSTGIVYFTPGAGL